MNRGSIAMDLDEPRIDRDEPRIDRDEPRFDLDEPRRMSTNRDESPGITADHGGSRREPADLAVTVCDCDSRLPTNRGGSRPCLKSIAVDLDLA